MKDALLFILFLIVIVLIFRPEAAMKIHSRIVGDPPIVTVAPMPRFQGWGTVLGTPSPMHGTMLDASTKRAGGMRK